MYTPREKYTYPVGGVRALKDVTINVAFMEFPVSGLMFSLLGRYELSIITEE